jgi:starch synthase (maltosyl-transferring)
LVPAHPTRGGCLLRPTRCATATPLADRVAAASSATLTAMMAMYADRSPVTESAVRRVWVDRERARFGAWYELLPRVGRPDPSRSARSASRRRSCRESPTSASTWSTCRRFTRSARASGRDGTIRSSPNRAIPAARGRSDRTRADTPPSSRARHARRFRGLSGEVERLGLEVALDLAFQCSPDHPWVSEHPEWFSPSARRHDQVRREPAKKYQDIYPIDFACDDWRALWQALLEVTQFWIERGVAIFRVDNPHTKTFGFWEWLIDRVHARHPEVLFLSEGVHTAEADALSGQAGFSQSYTYFTWRNTKPELVEYFTELTADRWRDVLRPNLFANTPDILHAYLQRGGPPAFRATADPGGHPGASYGVYSGFELCEGRALAPGSEEYADSEKYQFRQWDWDRPGNIRELVSRVNAIRHRHPALHYFHTLRFHDTDNAAIIAYSKTAPHGTDRLLTIVNLDPHHMQHATSRCRCRSDETFTVRDLLDDVEYEWRGEWNYVRFDPEIRQAHILSIDGD